MFKYLVWQLNRVDCCDLEDSVLVAAKAYQMGVLDGLLAALDFVRSKQEIDAKQLTEALYMTVSEVLEEYIEISRHELPFFTLRDWSELARKREESSKNTPAPVVVKPQATQG